MAASTQSGRTQRRASHAGRIRRPNLRRYYANPLSRIVPGDFEFDLTLLRGKGFRNISLDPLTDSLQWNDEAAVLTGTITLHRPDPDKPKSLPLRKGHRVRCRVRWPGHSSWFELWTMRCSSPEVTVEENVLSVDLTDDLDLLRRNRRDWIYRKTKRRKAGYFAHEIARDVARREGVKLGRIARGTKRIHKLVARDKSALDVLRAAYQHEHDATGRRFVIRMFNGRLEVVPYRRNPLLYRFSEQLTSAVTDEAEKNVPATVLEGKGHVGKGKDAKKLRHTELRRSVVDRFGYIHRTKDYGRVRSMADLVAKVRRDYAKQIRTTRTATLSTPGVPFLRRGDGCQWVTKETGWYGRSDQSLDRSFVFVTAVRHSVDPDGYVTEFDISQVDPFVKAERQAEKEQRARKRRARARRRGHHS